MREAIRLLRSRNQPQKDPAAGRLLKRIRGLTFGPVSINSLEFDRYGGSGFGVSFPHPRPYKAEFPKNITETKKSMLVQSHYASYWESNRQILRKGSVLMFIQESNSDFIRFGDIVRGNHPKNQVETDKDTGISRIIVRFDSTQFPHAISDMIFQQKKMLMVQMDFSFFAYKPVLKRLQQMGSTQFISDVLLDRRGSRRDQFKEAGTTLKSQHDTLGGAVDKLKTMRESNAGIKSLLPNCSGSTGSFALDRQQCEAVELAFSSPISLIQGPPGTGKSLCGAVIGALLHQFTNLRVLCLCYTNHALDDFLTNLIQIGIPTSDVLRIGSGSRADASSALAETNLDFVKGNSKIVVERAVRRLISKNGKGLSFLENTAKHLQNLAKKMGRKLWSAFKEYFGEYDAESLSAFELSFDTDGFTLVNDSKGLLWQRWLKGKSLPRSYPEDIRKHELWALSRRERDDKISQWMQDVCSRLQRISTEYNNTIADLQNLRDEEVMLLLQQRRIIGCTTTGASIYSHLLDSAGIDVLIMEEAGEILEAHTIAAIGTRVQQMILIGDHLQLRPKIQNHLLSTDASNGRFGLDMSLFERLILNQIPYVCLEEQHRMCESVASFVRKLTYPSLRSAPSVRNRRNLIGFPHNVIFVDHSEAENSAMDLRGSGSAMSRTNSHEVDWVIAIIEYILWQPEYSSNDIVVLALYLDQLLQLRKALSRCRNAHVRLNERDVADLVKAGENIKEAASAEKSHRKEIRVSTVDNFQGEEGNIVIASLVRSNDNGDIGFVSQAQRINVLLSRAREGMIFVGNSTTLMKSHKGGKMWGDIIDMFKSFGGMNRGITVSCRKHDTTQQISSPRDFREKAPHGGCDQPCDLKLKCGHLCSQKCHRGSCTEICLECMELEKIRKEKEKVARERDQSLAKRKNQIVKIEREIEKMVLDLREKEDRMEDQLNLERLKLQQELLKQENKLLETTSREKIGREKKRLQLRFQQKFADIENRKAELSQRSAVGHHELNAKYSSCAQDEQDPTERPGDIIDPAATSRAQTSDTTERNDSSYSNGDELQQTLEDEWKELRMKLISEERKSMDELMKLVGLASVKNVALEIFRKQLADRQLKIHGKTESIIKPTLNFTFVGNPGTGKTTVARLFAGILAESGARTSNRFEILSASDLLRKGEKLFEARICSMCGNVTERTPPIGSMLRKNLKVEVQGSDDGWYAASIVGVEERNNKYTVLFASDESVEEHVSRDRIRAGSELRKEGGVLFIDEAYDLAPSRNQKGAAIVNLLMEAAEKHRGYLTIILAGYQKDIEDQLFAFNTGMPSRFRQIVFEDFQEAELGRIWTGLCVGSGYICKSDVMKIAARRVSRGRNTRGFGNARDVRNLFEISCTRSFRRNFDGILQITAADVLGQRPTLKDPKIAEVMNELDQLIGVPQVKATFKSLFDLAVSNYERELEGSPAAHVPLNRVFVGNPGTGKTTVARLYGLLLKALGFLSNGEVISKVASDLMGQYVGQARERTKAILENARGKVLLIDEAYGLDDENYGKQALTTIVERVSGAPGEDIAVVLVGYEQEIRLMIDRQNPGLKRRFNMESCRVVFDDFSDEELGNLMELECRKSGVKISDRVHAHALKLLIKQRAKANFGNAGNVTTLIKSAVARWVSRNGSKHNKELSIYDIDPSFGKNSDPMGPLNDLEDTPVRKYLMNLALQIQQRQREGRSVDNLLGNYVFLGGPGTGKTTIARMLAKILFDMGVLASDLVVETSSSDLIGSYVGHSRANVERKMKEARGGICFIDEAYHLGVGQFGGEALTQLLTMLTLPEYMDGKTVVVLAGYEKEVHKMLDSNPGLKSRFSSFLHFEDWAPEKCAKFVCDLAAKEAPLQFKIDEKGKEALLEGFQKIQMRPGWANARDAIHIYKQIVSERDIRMANTISSTDETVFSLISVEDVSRAISRMLQARPKRSVTIKTDHLPQNEEPVLTQETRKISREQVPRGKKNPQREEMNSPSEPKHTDLEADACEERCAESEQEVDDKTAFYSELLQELAILESSFTGTAQQKEAEGFTNEKQRLETDKAKVDALERERKNIRRQALAAKKKQERRRLLEEARMKEVIIQKRLANERKRQAIRRALMAMGKCPQGFVWIRSGNGYRCAGGSHYVNFEEIAVRTGFTTEEVAEAFEK